MFTSATLLIHDFLVNEFGYITGLSAKEEEIKFKDYYIIVCGLIKNNCYLEPSPSSIEGYLTDGEYEYDEDNIITCPIEDVDDRKEIFKRAMAKQLIYDFENGRGAMQADFEAQKRTICPDTIECLNLLGLWQRNHAIK